MSLAPSLTDAAGSDRKTQIRGQSPANGPPTINRTSSWPSGWWRHSLHPVLAISSRLFTISRIPANNCGPGSCRDSIEQPFTAYHEADVDWHCFSFNATQAYLLAHPISAPGLSSAGTLGYDLESSGSSIPLSTSSVLPPRLLALPLMQFLIQRLRV